MDEIVTISRIEKGTPLTYAEQDANTAALKTGIEQAYAESFKYTDAAELDEPVTTIEDEDRFILANSLFDPEEPVGEGNQPFKEIEYLDLLAAVLGEIPDGPGTAAEIRDALETLTDADRLHASAIQNLPPNILTIGDSLTELVGSDVVVVIRGGVPYHTTLAAVQTFVGGAPSATAPAAFEAGDWTATAGVEQIAVDITALPDDGDSAITELQYRIDGGSPVAFTGTGTGVRNITGLTGEVEVDVEIRAVNAIGSGAWSDVKSRTPTTAAIVAWLDNTTPTYSTENTDHSLPITPMVPEVGDFLLMLKHNWNIPTVETDLAQALAQLAAYPTAGSGENGQAYGVLLSGVPTTVEAAVSPASDIGYMLAIARGVTALGGTATYEHLTPAVDPITALPYTATVPIGLVAIIASHHPDTRVTAATFNGGAGLVIEGWIPDFDLILGVHDGSTGANSVAITTNVPSMEMRLSVLELVP